MVARPRPAMGATCVSVPVRCWRSAVSTLPDHHEFFGSQAGGRVCSHTPRHKLPHPPGLVLVAAHVDIITPYILCVGSLQPHKNLHRAIDAWKLVRRRRPNLELWIIGKKQGGFRDATDYRALLSQPGIAALGYVTEAKLLRAYVGAAAFVYPSLEEGFGLPVLEAMQAGTPVITSNCSCLPEVAGGAAELVEPMSTESIATAIENVLDWTESERQARIAHGKERANQFSWSAAAREYITLYHELAG